MEQQCAEGEDGQDSGRIKTKSARCNHLTSCPLGTARRMAGWAARVALALVLGFLVLVQLTFLYEHLTQVRAPAHTLSFAFHFLLF